MIDNGRKRRLFIAGLFDGEAGEQGGELAFIPNLSGKRPSQVSSGLLDDEPIRLKLKSRPSSATPLAVFSYWSDPA